MQEYEERRLLGCGAVWILLRTDVSEESAASTFRVEKYANEKSVRRLLTVLSV
jgi:hypothetical protein